MQIDIEKIEVGERLRSRLDPVKLRQLADDMERNGQLQEIVAAIKWGTNSRGTTVVDKATLIAGYRRLEAAKLLGWTTIRCTKQLDGDINPDCKIDLLRAEFSENELRDDFTEMERVAFGVKIKEQIAATARERMLAGKKVDFEYDPETGYKVWNETSTDITDDNTPAVEVASMTADPPLNLVEGIADNNPLKTASDPVLNSAQGLVETEQYDGGKVIEYVARKIGMGKDKFRQGEYVLKHGTEEQHAAIDRGETSIFGVYNDLKLKPAPVTIPATGTIIHLPPTVPAAPPKNDHPKPAKLSKEEHAMAAPPPKEREIVERNNAFTAMTPEQKIVELQSQLKEARARAAGAESDLAREKELRQNVEYHLGGTIEMLKGQLEAAHARIKELEERFSGLEE